MPKYPQIWSSASAAKAEKNLLASNVSTVVQLLSAGYLRGECKCDNVLFIYRCIYFKLYKGNLFVKEQSAISVPLSVIN